MNDIPRNKYEILDLVFTILIALCLISTAIFLFSNLIVSIIYIVFVALFGLVVLFFWVSRNPFNIYLVRTFAFSNFIATFISLIIFFSNFNPTSTDYPGYILLLIPSGIYLLISFKFSAISTPSDKKEGAMLALVGLPNASQRRLFRDNPKERIKRKELIAKQRKIYKFKPLIGLCIAFILISSVALILGFS